MTRKALLRRNNGFQTTRLSHANWDREPRLVRVELNCANRPWRQRITCQTNCVTMDSPLRLQLSAGDRARWLLASSHTDSDMSEHILQSDTTPVHHHLLRTLQTEGAVTCASVLPRREESSWVKPSINLLVFWRVYGLFVSTFAAVTLLPLRLVRKVDITCPVRLCNLTVEEHYVNNHIST